MYNLYSEENLEFSGLSRNFLFRRLEPWTTYTLTLEACTSAGCTRTPPQHITTAAAPPASQPPPRPLFIGPDKVSLTWGPPTQPNGPIGEYVLVGRSLEDMGRGRSNEEDMERGKVGDHLVLVLQIYINKSDFTGLHINIVSFSGAFPRTIPTTS